MIFPWVEEYLQQAMPQNCIYDWKFKKITYQGCAKVASKKSWCPTKVDSNMNWIRWNREWCKG